MRTSLVLLCLLLAGAIVLETRQAAPPGPLRAARQAAGSASAALPSGSFGFADLAQYSAIVERPLFHPSRRPVQAQAQAKSASAAGQRELLLAGVLIMSNRKLALLQQAGSQDIIRLRPGSELNDWVLMEVAEDHVTMRRGTELRELRVHR